MTDRELLHKAAKAAGYKLHALLMDQRAIDSPDAIALALSDPYTTWWNPLDDDGDALRLAANLYLFEPIRLAHRDVTADVDIYAATRRAIVRAAAEIADAGGAA